MFFVCRAVRRELRPRATRPAVRHVRLVCDPAAGGLAVSRRTPERCLHFGIKRRFLEGGMRSGFLRRELERSAESLCFERSARGFSLGGGGGIGSPGSPGRSDTRAVAETSAGGSPVDGPQKARAVNADVSNARMVSEA
ncbi:hypothetical protein SKAU_G00123860 [Synaphobranchus kaupii]|uniref:Uncharacterized protein n=1 Tax=Synaphobranchus kaupii TaxID=118154 RepID=A0A9Q1FPQ7_SYNKA|nr:hypothetical protein SKAU_G00123860 [Synaphobranchus kaupii]